MGILLSLPLFFGNIVYFIHNKKIGYLNIFSLMWAIIFLLSSLKLFNMLPFTDDIYIILGVGVYLFIIFFIVSQYTFNKRKNKLIEKNYELNYKLLIIIEILVFLFALYTFSLTLKMLMSGVSMGVIHARYLNRGDIAFYSSSIMREIHSKFAVPFIYCISPITSYLLTRRNKRNIMLIIMNIVILLLWIISTGGRMLIIYLIVDLILIYPLFKEQIAKLEFKKMKSIVKKLIMVFLIFIIYYTFFRKGFINSGQRLIKIAEELYDYITLCVPLSAHWLNNIKLSGGYLFGSATAYGVLSLFNFVINRLHFGHLSFLLSATQLLTNFETMIIIFENASCNAFVTCFIYFYADFGYVGVIVLSSIFGFISGRVEKKAKDSLHSSNCKYLLIYLLYSQCIIKSFVRFEFSSAAYVLAYIYILLILKEGVNTHEKQD